MLSCLTDNKDWMLASNHTVLETNRGKGKNILQKKLGGGPHLFPEKYASSYTKLSQFLLYNVLDSNRKQVKQWHAKKAFKRTKDGSALNMTLVEGHSSVVVHVSHTEAPIFKPSTLSYRFFRQQDCKTSLTLLQYYVMSAQFFTCDYFENFCLDPKRQICC